jgi:hypothetical protein
VLEKVNDLSESVRRDAGNIDWRELSLRVGLVIAVVFRTFATARVEDELRESSGGNRQLKLGAAATDKDKILGGTIHGDLSWWSRCCDCERAWIRIVRNAAVVSTIVRSGSWDFCDI